MIVIIDHRDSFVYNLSRYVQELGYQPHTLSSDDIDSEEILAKDPSHLILSPGPGRPSDYPGTLHLLRRAPDQLPVLGVCLGHQCIAEAFGAAVSRARHPMHGMASPVLHDGRSIYRGLPARFNAGRYHSLAVVAHSLPENMEVTATADDGEVMGIRHRDRPIEGVQFHPESVLTEHGYLLMANFILSACGAH